MFENCPPNLLFLERSVNFDQFSRLCNCLGKLVQTFSTAALNLPKPGTLIGKSEKRAISPEMLFLYEKMRNSRRNALKMRNLFRMSGREGVRLYKALHRTVQRVFRGDRAAMFAARDKVLHHTCYVKRENCRVQTLILVCR